MSMEQFRNFVMDVWTQPVFGGSIGVWLSAILLLLLGVLLRGWVSRLIIKRLTALAARSKNTFDDEFVFALKRPISLLVLVAAVYFSLSLLPLNEESRLITDKIINSVFLYAVFRAFLELTDPLLRLSRKLNGRFDLALIDWLRRIIRVVIVILGAGAIFEVWGIPVASILAGLGLVGAAVALGAQELFKNLISGIMIIAERRFEVGDWIKVEGVVEGTVEWIGFRSTRIQRFDMGPVYVPNGHLADNPMINFTKRDHRRIYMTIGLDYATSVVALEDIRNAARDWIVAHPKIENPDQISTFVNIDSFQDSAIGLMIYCFTNTTNWGEWLEVKEELLLALKGIVAEAGSDFAFPSQSIYLKEYPPEAINT